MPSSHLDLAIVCRDLYDAPLGPNKFSFDDGRTYVLDVRQEGQAVYGLTKLEYGSVLSGSTLVNVLAFRGSKEVGDFVVDAAAVKTPSRFGYVHVGFRDDYIEWLPAAEQLRGRPIVVVGHSLGGALATQAALTFGTDSLEVVTFGCPRVGDSVFAEAYWNIVGKRTVRYDYLHDPVPWVPPWCWGFRHVVSATWWNGSQWQIGVSPMSMARKMLKARSLRDKAEDLGESLKGVLEQHHIDNYIEVLRG